MEQQQQNVTDTTTTTTSTTMATPAVEEAIPPTHQPAQAEAPHNDAISKAIAEAQANVESKLILANVGKNVDGPKLEKILKSYGVKFSKCKKGFGSNCGAAWFDSAADKEDAKAKLANAVMKNGKTIEVLECTEVNKRRLERIRSRDDGERSSKRQKTEDGSEAAAEKQGPTHVNDVVAPLWREPYDAQIVTKSKRVRSTLSSIANRLRKAGAPLASGEIPFAGDGRVHISEAREGYRNKLSFTVGTDAEGVRRVGFSEGAFGMGKMRVADVGTGCILVGKRIEEIRLRFEKYVQESPRDVFHKDTHEGFWRQLEVRSFRTGESCAVVQVNPTGVPAEEIAKEKEALIKILAVETGVTSLYFQLHDGISNFAQTAPELIHGPKYIRENILGLTFNVSPGSFFQTNSWAVETLYGIVRDWCKEIVTSDIGANNTNNDQQQQTQIKKKSILFDVCCGTGTIGQVLARDCFAGDGACVVGVDIAEDAIRDAEQNAALNADALANCDLKYIAGKAEDHMRSMAESYVGSARNNSCVIAVVDPPRSGLHPSVLRAMRNCWSLTHIIYVSCNPTTLVNDVEALCRPVSRSMQAKPFVPVKATGVDMFPHTEHLEMVMVLKRDPPSK